MTAWQITEQEINSDKAAAWQDVVIGSLEDAWFSVADTINGISVAPADGYDYNDGAAALWPGAQEQISPTQMRVVYWRDSFGEGPQRVESIITVSTWDEE